MEFDMRVGKARPARPVDFHRRQVYGSGYERSARRPEGHRLGQTRVTAPPRHLRQIEGPAAFVQRGEGRSPALRNGDPPLRVRGPGTLLVIVG